MTKLPRVTAAKIISALEREIARQQEKKERETLELVKLNYENRGERI